MFPPSGTEQSPIGDLGTKPLKKINILVLETSLGILIRLVISYFTSHYFKTLANCNVILLVKETFS